jgi:hypothetical protein
MLRMHLMPVERDSELLEVVRANAEEPTVKDVQRRWLDVVQV